MTTINKKNFEIDKIRTLHDLDLLLKIRHQEVKVWCLANNLREKKKFCMFEFPKKRKYISNLIFSIAVIKFLIKSSK